MKTQGRLKKRETFVKINSFVLASFFSLSVLYEVSAARGLSGVSTLYMVAVMVLGVVNILLLNEIRIKRRKMQQFSKLMALLLTAYGLTVVFSSVPTTMEPMKFVMWVAAPAFFITLDYDVERILRYSMYLSLLSFFDIRALLSDNMVSIRFAQASLGVIYDMLPCVVAALFHFCYYRVRSSIFTKICYVYYLYVLVLMLPVIVRGALLSLLVGGIIIYLNRPDKEGLRIKRWTLKKKIFLLVVVALGVLVILNYELIIVGIYEILEAQGINFGFITKFYIYVQAGNVMDGRDNYYNIALEWFMKSPIWGNGIETFYAYSGDNVPYPHNYLLQFLFEGGILLTLPILFQVGKLFYSLFSSQFKQKDSAALLGCFSVVSIIPGLFSMDMWLLPTFWMAIMSIMIIGKSKREKIKKGRVHRVQNLLSRNT